MMGLNGSMQPTSTEYLWLVASATWNNLQALFLQELWKPEELILLQREGIVPPDADLIEISPPVDPVAFCKLMKKLIFGFLKTFTALYISLPVLEWR